MNDDDNAATDTAFVVDSTESIRQRIIDSLPILTLDEEVWC